ncbi:MAG TPA: leucine-rich repeat domain-containing protein [Verrucomicrobiae bacterium]
MTAIGAEAFFYGHWTSVTIPYTVATIGDEAFFECTSLTNIASVDNPDFTSIGDSAFASCSALASMPMPATLTNIGTSAFAQSGLTNVTIPGSVNKVGDFAFDSCGGLTNATISSGVTSIGVYAFDNCGALATVTIPSTVTNIEVPSFSQCGKLSAITVDPANPYYSSMNGSLFDKGQTALFRYVGSSAASFTIPESVTNLADYAFSMSTSLTNIGLPGNLALIGQSAFLDCINLTTVTLPASLWSVGSFAFQSCFKLTNVFFAGNAPASDTSIFMNDSYARSYYLAGTSGWGVTFAFHPLSTWNPQIRTNLVTFGVRTNRFGFTINGASNLQITVEACTNLNTATWSPLTNLTLTNGSTYFSDSTWTNYSGRFYRITSP